MAYKNTIKDYSQMIGYLTRDKTTDVPGSMVHEARNMKLAEVPRSDMDNVNTPDLDQGADSILRPGETLEDFDVTFRRPNAEGGRIDFNKGGDATRLKALEADYIKFGKKKLNKAANVLGFEDYASMSGEKNNNFRRKIREQLTKYGEVLPKGYDSDVRGRKTRIPKEQNIQIKLLEETNKKNFFDPKQFAIDNDISLAKVKKQAERLQTNIYKKRMLEAGKDVGVTLEWIPKDPKFSDNTLNKLWKSKLIKYEREKIDELFYDAFGREKIKGTNKKNPSFNNKKFLAIKKNLNEYRKLRNAINAKYPNINFELDHPLSKSTLKKMFNASAEELTRVNPLEADLNNGFKDAVSQQYEKAMGDPKKGIKPNLNKKKAVEKIARDLKLNIGKINNDATNFKYGVKEFQKLNMKDEILKAVQNQADLSSNFKTYVKNNPELFKTANVNPNANITKITQGQVKQVASLLEKLGCGQAAGGRILFSKGTPGASLTECGKKGVAKFIDDLKSGNYSKATKDVLKGGGNLIKNIANPMELLKLRNLIGPGALGFMAAFEAGVITDDVIRQGTPLNESLANNWLTKTFLPYTQEYAKAKNLLETGKVPSNMKKYVQDVVTFNESLKDMEGIQGNVDSRLVDVGGYGMGDGSSMYSKEKEDKDVNNLIKKMSTISEDVITPGTGKALKMKALQNESEATRMAKKEFSPFLGFDKLKDVRTEAPTGILDYMDVPDPKEADLRPITYQDAEYTDVKMPVGLEQFYMNKLNLKPRDSLSNYKFKNSDISILEELTDDYNAFQRHKEASKYPGYFGANEKFSEGGITGLRSKYEYKK